MNALDITQFDSVKDCAGSFELAVKNADGTAAGFSLLVIGKHSDPVQNWNAAIVNRALIEENMARKSGEIAPPKSVEEMRAQNIDGAVVRVVGWKGVKQDYSADLLRQALSRNPHWIDQIIKASDNLGNFTKAQ